jgi:hypothetical protein
LRSLLVPTADGVLILLDGAIDIQLGKSLTWCWHRSMGEEIGEKKVSKLSTGEGNGAHMKELVQTSKNLNAFDWKFGSELANRRHAYFGVSLILGNGKHTLLMLVSI